MATLSQWIAGARPRTLPVAVAPVAVGTGSAYTMKHANPGYALLALCVAGLLQIGVNYANDYSDGLRGTDHERVGPVRLVGQRLAPAANVKMAAFICFFFAALCGLALVTLSNTFWLILLGIASIWAAWKYTGGEHPYGYLGFGEIFVFLFFGLAATLGTTYTQAHRVDATTVMGAVGVGAIACAILVVNNLRDIPGDTVSGKKTLAVRIGDRATRGLYVGLFALALAAVVGCALAHPWAAIGALGLLPAVPGIRAVLRGAHGRDLIPALTASGMTALSYGVLLGLGLWLSYYTSAS